MLEKFPNGGLLLACTMDYLRMDGKRGHMTCRNQSAIERKESFQTFASFEALLRPLVTLQDFAWLDLELDKMKICFKVYV